MPTPPPPAELQALLALLADPNAVRERDAVQVLDFVRHARDGLRSYESNVARVAHDEGLSWEKIGRALNMTKQGAQRRYDA